MREIVYRQAIFSGGKFNHWHPWGFIGGNFIAPLTSTTSDLLAALEHSQEFTGLKDKNGVEICEGDILLAADTYTDRILDDGSGPQEPFNHLAPVEYHEGAFGLAIAESGDCYHTGFRSFAEILWDIGDQPDEMEVIGNIYESLHLLAPNS